MHVCSQPLNGLSIPDKRYNAGHIRDALLADCVYWCWYHATLFMGIVNVSLFWIWPLHYRSGCELSYRGLSKSFLWGHRHADIVQFYTFPYTHVYLCIHIHMFAWPWLDQGWPIRTGRNRQIWDLIDNTLSGTKKSLQRCQSQKALRPNIHLLSARGVFVIMMQEQYILGATLLLDGFSYSMGLEFSRDILGVMIRSACNKWDKLWAWQWEVTKIDDLVLVAPEHLWSSTKADCNRWCIS